MARWHGHDMGVVGGLVGLLGGLGGFFLPLMFSAAKGALGPHAAFEVLLGVSVLATAVLLVSMLRLRALGRQPTAAYD